MDWDRLYHAAMMGGIILVLTMVSWCVLAALFLLLMTVGDAAFYIGGVVAWALATHFFYNSGHLDS